MFGQDYSLGAPSAAGAVAVQVSRPQPAPRVVEGSSKARLQQHETPSMYVKPPSSLQQLSSSAREFADVLDRTGNVDVAVSISGFRSARLDVYA